MQYMSETQKQARARVGKVERAVKLLNEVQGELESMQKREERAIKRSNYELLPSLDLACEAVIIEGAVWELDKVVEAHRRDRSARRRRPVWKAKLRPRAAA